MSLLRNARTLQVLVGQLNVRSTQLLCRTKQTLGHPIVFRTVSQCCCKELRILDRQADLLPTLSSVRWYAKKHKKDKGGKKSSKPKVTLSHEELNAVFDYGKFTQLLEVAVEELKQSYAKQLSVRTTSAAFDQLVVHTEDGKFPLIQLAQITQKNPQLLIINMASAPQYIIPIKEAIEKSGLNVNPQQDGTTLFVPVPKVTREHRETLAKSAKTLCDRTKEKLRDIQNRYVRDIKKQKGEHSEDLLHALQENVQLTAHQFSDVAEATMKAKQQELLA